MIFTIIFIIMLTWLLRENYMIRPDDATFYQAVEAAVGRRTITRDSFPDHEPYLSADFYDNMASSETDKYMTGEAFNEEFVNTRECRGAAQLNKTKGFSLPTRWDDTVCETHCPDHNMIGTRADSAGNLSINARDALYNHVGWNEHHDIDYSQREYYGLQGYSYKDRVA